MIEKIKKNKFIILFIMYILGVYIYSLFFKISSNLHIFNLAVLFILSLIIYTKRSK